MRENNLNLPFIDSRKLFATELSSKRLNRYTSPKPYRNRDRSQILSKFIDSSIIKKTDRKCKELDTTPTEVSKNINVYDEDEQPLVIQKECTDRTLRCTKAVFKFYQQYKRLDKIIDENKVGSYPQSPYTAMLERSQKIMAFPSTMGVVKTKGKGNSISIPNYFLGDHKSEVISAALSQVKEVKQLNLSKNRLTDKGIQQIINKITNDLSKLNLSDNKISIIHPSLLKIIGTGACQLTYLNLQNNRLDDQSINTMSMVLSLNRSVKYLNLGRNHLTRGCIQAISLIIESSRCLQELYIRWNKINGPLTKLIFQKLQTNSNLLLFDYSHNVISEGTPSVANSISLMLIKNKTLLHVDLSFNNFTLDQSTQIAAGLKKNRTIYGFHFMGNFGYVDCKGFLKFDQNQENISAETGYIKIQSFDVVHRRPKIGLTAEKMKDVCWICEGWSPQEIYHQIDNSIDKFAEIHLNYEAYEPKVIQVQLGWLRFNEMFPPQQVKFYFSNKNGEFILPDFEVRQQIFHKVNPDETTSKVLKKVNVSQKKVLQLYSNGKINTKILPRTPDVVRKQAKKKWRYADSMWAREWKRDDQELNKKCFQRDWGHSKISNIVKIPEQQQKVRTILHQHYKNIKEIYRYFASFSPFDGVWAISSNAFTQFCNQAKIISKELPLKIVDLTFITTNSMTGADWKSSSMVPDRGLVRFQFLQSIVRLADQKFKKSGVVQTIFEAVTSMINLHLVNIYPKHQSEAWRETVYFVQECDILLKRFRPVFTHIFKRNSKLKVKPGQKPFMCLDEFKSICERAGMFVGSTAERNAFINFNSSFMTQVDEVESERIIKMNQMQMIQALARMSGDVNFCILNPDMSEKQKQSRPLYQRLQQMIYVLIQKVCGEQIKTQFPIPSNSIFNEVKEDDDD